MRAGSNPALETNGSVGKPELVPSLLFVKGGIHESLF